MLALKILFVIALVLFLIGRIPIGADVAFEQGRLTLSAKVLGVLLKLFPKEPAPPETEEQREKRQKQEEKKREKTAQKEAKKAAKKAAKAAKNGNQEKQTAAPKKKGLPLDLTVDEILEILKKVFHGLGKFRKFQIDRFKLDLLLTGEDPYNTAVQFGAVNAFLSALGPVCAASFTVKDCMVRTDVDFMAEKTKLDFGLALSIRIGQIFGALNAILFGAAGVLIKNRVRVTKRKLWLKYTEEGKKEAVRLAAEVAEEAAKAAEKEAAKAKKAAGKQPEDTEPDLTPITRSSLEEAKKENN